MNFEELAVFIVADDDLRPEYKQLKADLGIEKDLEKSGQLLGFLGSLSQKLFEHYTNMEHDN